MRSFPYPYSLKQINSCPAYTEPIIMRKKIAPDKWKHFWVGIPLGIVLQIIAFYYFTQIFTATAAAVFILILICYGFELFSLITKLGHHDLVDAIAGILGGAIGVGLVVLLKLIHVF